jgi:hypothetical protein
MSLRQLSYWNLALYAVKSCTGRYTKDDDERMSGKFIYDHMVTVLHVLWIIGARSEVSAFLMRFLSFLWLILAIAFTVTLALMTQTSTLYILSFIYNP